MQGDAQAARVRAVRRSPRRRGPSLLWMSVKRLHAAAGGCRPALGGLSTMSIAMVMDSPARRPGP